jgi:dethiobiotin synthetase
VPQLLETPVILVIGMALGCINQAVADCLDLSVLLADGPV